MEIAAEFAAPCKETAAAVAAAAADQAMIDLNYLVLSCWLVSAMCVAYDSSSVEAS